MPLDISFIPEHVTKAAIDAFGTFVDKLATNAANSSSAEPSPSLPGEPKSFFIDPDQMLDSFGIGYRETTSTTGQQFLRAAGDRVNVIAAIIQLRRKQFSSFCRIQPNKYSIGLRVRLRSHVYNPRRMTDAEKDRARAIEHFITNTGWEDNLERDNLTTFATKVVRDRYTIDQVCFEKKRNLGGGFHSFYAVDGATIRIIDPDRKSNRPTGAPPTGEALKKKARYVQVIDGVRERAYTSDEMAFLVANPRTDLQSLGYGISEVETLIQTITWLLWAQSHNARAFSTGIQASGVMNIKGKLKEVQLANFRKDFYNQLSGVSNAYRPAVMNSEGMEWVPFHPTNREMEYQLWLEFLVKCACAIFLCDGAEINFDMRGGVTQQPMFMSSNEAQQKLSKDRGLAPLLHFMAEGLNRHIVYPMDPRFELAFVGLDAKTEEQDAELAAKRIATSWTMNELRALDDLDPVKHGDIPMNPVYITYLGQLAMQQQQAAAMAQQGGQPPPPEKGPDGEDVDPGPQHREDEFEPAGPEEARGAKRLLEAVHGPAHDPSPTDPEIDPDIFREDWVDTVRDSLQPGDLRKSKTAEKPAFVLIDLD